MSTRYRRRNRQREWDTFLLTRDIHGLSNSNKYTRSISAEPPKGDLHRKFSVRKPAAILAHLKAFIHDPRIRGQVEELLEQHPVLRAKRRYRDRGGTWRIIPIFDVFLLVRAGFKHWEIAYHFGASREAITRIVRNFRRAGWSFRVASRPEKVRKRITRPSTGSVYNDRIDDLEQRYSRGELTHPDLVSSVLDQLDRKWANYERQWERNGIRTYGVGTALELFLDKALSYESRIGGGKRVTCHVNRDSRLAEELTQRTQCLALLRYWSCTHLGSWLFDHELYLRIEHNRRMRRINGFGCPSCLAWLRLPSKQRSYNNPRIGSNGEPMEDKPVPYSQNLITIIDKGSVPTSWKGILDRADMIAKLKVEARRLQKDEPGPVTVLVTEEAIEFVRTASLDDQEGGETTVDLTPSASRFPYSRCGTRTYTLL